MHIILLLLYVYNICKHKISVIQEKKKKNLTFMRVKGLKLYPLLSFKAPEQYNILKTGRDYYIAVSV